MNRPHPKAPFWLSLLGLALAAHPLRAGEPLGTDLFAGYSYAKVAGTGRNGANLAAGFHALGPIAGFVDASAHWGSDAGVSLDDLTLMAGPGVRFGKRGGTLVFARVLAGLLRDRASLSILDVDISEGSTRFAILAGGGIDVRVAGRFALRAQGDYLWHDVASEAASCAPGSSACSGDSGGSSGFRVSGGVVYRFGSAP